MKRKNVKRLMAILVAMVVCMPCILLLDGGPDAPYGHETFGWTNFFGFCWLAFLGLGGIHLITPKWVRDELSAYIGDEEEDETIVQQ